MPNPTPILFSWSGGKDSALALHVLLQQPEEWEVVALLTSVADQYGRVSHHGVREELLERQADAIGLPLDKLRIPASTAPCTNADYEALIGEKLAGYVARGVKHVGHGDIFLADLRAYREKNLAKLGMAGVFPIWQRDTRELVESFVALGFRAQRRRGFGPFFVGLGAAAIVLAGKFGFESDLAMYAGLGLLVGASIWNTWPRRATPACPACITT